MTKQEPDQTLRFADMFAAMGSEPRLRIVRHLLATHPTGAKAGDIQAELGIPSSTLSHHLEKLRNEELIEMRRDGTSLWYTANVDVLRELLSFLYAECCTRSQVISAEEILAACNS